MHSILLDQKIGAKHYVLASLFEDFNNVLTKYLRGVNGKTEYERLFGKHAHEKRFRVRRTCAVTQEKDTSNERCL